MDRLIIALALLIAAPTLAAPARYAVVQGGIVVNTVVYDPETSWSPPEGATLVRSDTAGVGHTYDGATFTAPAAPEPPLAVVLGQKIEAGVQITSTGTPSLNGTYAIVATSTADITSVAAYITAFGAFPAGQTTFAWLDAAGAPHVFADVTAFLSFARAVADYVAALKLAANARALGQNAPWPSSSKTIP